MNMPVTTRMLPAMSDEAANKVRGMEQFSRKFEQVEIHTDHVIHGGMYVRTIFIPADVYLTGALIKVPTTLIVSGDLTAYIGDDAINLCGYNVLPAMAGRKQAFRTYTDVHMTMIFPTKARTVEEAEQEFTDEVDNLMSRDRPDLNTITITGG